MATGKINEDVWYELQDRVVGDTIKRVALKRLDAAILNRHLKPCGFVLIRQLVKNPR